MGEGLVEVCGGGMGPGGEVGGGCPGWGVQLDRRGPPKGSWEDAESGREEDEEEEEPIGEKDCCGVGSGFWPARDGSGCWPTSGGRDFCTSDDSGA